jgi:hypothetical protein
MDARVDKDSVEYAVELLLKLIERSPADSRSHLRLLKLLHAKGCRHDFVIEAYQYQINCDLTIDADWNYVCQMGREITPGSEFFKRTLLKSHPQLKYQRPSGSPSADRTDTGQKAEPASHHTPMKPG